MQGKTNNMLLKYLSRISWLLYGWVELIVATAILYSLSYFPRLISRTLYFYLFRIWCKIFVNALGVDLRLHQKNTQPIPKHFILIANHPSAFEDIGIPALFNAYSLAKAEVAEWWWAGRIVEAAGNLFVKRESREARRVAAEKIVNFVNSGKNIVIYPEGGCKGRRIFHTFVHGAFDISMKTGVPILPVFLHYESQDDFEWREPQTLPHKLWHMTTTQNNRANYYLYDAIYPDKFDSKEAYNEHVHKLYLQWQARYLE